MYNKKVSHAADLIYVKFKNDICNHSLRIQNRWERQFNEIDNSASGVELITAVNDIFCTGSRYIEDIDRYLEFRNMYHELYDLASEL